VFQLARDVKVKMRKTKYRKSKPGCTAMDGGVCCSNFRNNEKRTVFRGRRHVEGFLQCDKAGTEELSRVDWNVSNV